MTYGSKCNYVLATNEISAVPLLLYKCRIAAPKKHISILVEIK